MRRFFVRFASPIAVTIKRTCSSLRTEDRKVVGSIEGVYFPSTQLYVLDWPSEGNTILPVSVFEQEQELYNRFHSYGVRITIEWIDG